MYQYRLKIEDNQYVVYKGKRRLPTETFETSEFITIQFMEDTEGIEMLWTLKEYPIHEQFVNPACRMLDKIFGG